MMGGSQQYINRLSNPFSELKEVGYTEEQIKDLITIDGKTVHISDRDLRKQAGNSIVVNVLHHVFESLFFG